MINPRWVIFLGLSTLAGFGCASERSFKVSFVDSSTHQVINGNLYVERVTPGRGIIQMPQKVERFSVDSKDDKSYVIILKSDQWANFGFTDRLQIMGSSMKMSGRDVLVVSPNRDSGNLFDVVGALSDTFSFDYKHAKKVEVGDDDIVHIPTYEKK